MLLCRLLCCVAFLIANIAVAQGPDKAGQPAKPRYETKADHDPDGIGKFYMNREIAQVMGHLGIGWLERPEREEEEEPGEAAPHRSTGHVAAFGQGGQGDRTLIPGDGPPGHLTARFSRARISPRRTTVRPHAC